MEALKCWNLEGNIHAELQQMPVPVTEALTMIKFVQDRTPLPQGATCDSAEC